MEPRLVLERRSNMGILRRVAVTAVSIAMVAVASGCDGGAAAGTKTSDSGGVPANIAELDRQAKDALSRWEPVLAAHGTATPFLLHTDPTTVIGDVSADGAAFKQAWLSGRFQAAVSLPTAAPPDATLNWPGGGTAQVPVTSAADALRALQTPTSTPCEGCTAVVPLKAVSVVPGTARLLSTRGPVEVPTWIFSFDGYHTRIARLAIAQSAPLFAQNAPDGPPGDYQPQESVTVAPDGRSLTVSLNGTKADGSCDWSITGHAFESAHAVSVDVAITHRASVAPGAGSCPSAGAAPGMTLILAAPLGTRMVLAQGLPTTVAHG